MVSAFAFVTAFVFVIGFTWNPRQDGAHHYFIFTIIIVFY